MSATLKIRAGLLVLISLPLGSMASRAAEIVVSWTEVQEQVRPREATLRVTKSVSLSLQGGNVISDSAVATNKRGLSKSSNVEGRLGESMKSKGGSLSTWQVKDRNTLVRTTTRAQHVDTVQVTTLTDTTCRATVAFSLKAGFNEYRLLSIANREPLYFRALSAENVSCRVTK